MVKMAKSGTLYKPIRRRFDKGGGKSKTRIIIFPPLTKTPDQSSLARISSLFAASRPPTKKFR